MDRPLRVTCLRARTSDRTDGAGAGAQALAERATSCVVQREVGTSDHGPVVATFDVHCAATKAAENSATANAETGRLF